MRTRWMRVRARPRRRTELGGASWNSLPSAPRRNNHNLARCRAGTYSWNPDPERPAPDDVGRRPGRSALRAALDGDVAADQLRARERRGAPLRRLAVVLLLVELRDVHAIRRAAAGGVIGVEDVDEEPEEPGRAAGARHV